jgi:hypothetical protein
MRRKYFEDVINLLNNDNEEIFDRTITYCKSDIKLVPKMTYLPICVNRSCNKWKTQLLQMNKVVENEYDLSHFSSFNVSDSETDIEKDRSIVSFLEALYCVENVSFIGDYTSPISNDISFIETYRSNNEKLVEDLPGDHFLWRILNTRCAVAISGGDYLGNAVFEAIQMDKKLLTDCDLVKHEPWYDHRFIRVFVPGSCKKQDILWAMEPADVHYENKDSITLETYLDRILDF